MTNDISEATLLKKFSTMESDQLIEMRQQGDRTELAMDVIERILSERGVAITDRAEVEQKVAETLSQNQAEIDARAPIGLRFVAQIIDSILAFSLLFILAFLIHILVGVLAFVLYLLFQDGLPNGQSVGKRMLSIAVVDKLSGKACGLGESFIRNIVLLVLGIIDILFVFSESRQRLGDRAAKTIVVKVNKSPDN